MSAMSPAYAEDVERSALTSKADALFSASCVAEAASIYELVLATEPGNVHVLHQMGLACARLNKIVEASAYLERALRLEPERGDLLEHAGLIAAMRGDYANSELFYRRALSLIGSTATLHRNLADCLRLRGRLEEAKAEYIKAITREPELHHAVRAVAQISTDLGESDDAAAFWLRALAIDNSSLKDGIDALLVFGKVKQELPLSRLVSELRMRHATDATALEALCLALYRTDRFAEMFSVARQGIALDLQSVCLHRYAAHALSVRGYVKEAMAYSAEAVRLQPADEISQFQHAELEINASNYEVGWSRHNLFYNTPLARSTRVFPESRIWEGEPVNGRTFLLVGEQGRGDEIQFVRFAEWLHQQGAVVDVLVSESVAVIARSMTGVRSVLTRLPQGPYDYWSHMQRMPEHMGLRLSTLPIAMPYVAAPPHLIAFWKARLEALAPSVNRSGKLRVGIVWAGGPHSALDRFRSIDIHALKPLFSVPGTTWFSLQKGEREREGEALTDAFDFHTLGPVIEDFGDTLAILATLDLVVSVDTSVAHLAGAANLPVWVLVPAYAQWRWLQERTDSPWYPSMRLFRQRELGNWDSAIGEVRAALEERHLKASEKSPDR
ncbi:tetratricopeptide repeat protein [Burkholderia sp. WSM2232]|uniref:tetratricopeptide repeat protein n=1 Tax=Burkholderia sp. WSM2232 TaxID=944436 RepID=UPI00054DF1C0|nr:tetratricopeptide repeat-containing glycosyltransferase family protein [Burkholderia sp. WSM2232]